MVYTTQTMIALEQITSLKEYFQSAQSIAIVLGPKPTVDQVASTAAATAILRNVVGAPLTCL